MREVRRDGPASLKPSRYKFTFPLDDGTRLAFSAGTAALAEIDSETFPAFARVLDDPNTDLTPEESDLRRQLLEGGYLVPSEVDEVERLREKHEDHRSRNPVFMLTVAPTLACNFDCDYCFQRHETGRMTRGTEEALIAFSEERIRRSSGVMVTWFGGEPTLCMLTIERIQGAIQDLSARHGVAVEPASIVTNGYLLDARMAARLAAAGIHSAQVTLDGPEELHDRRRRLRGGGGTFRRILHNLSESAGILGITIRVNVDQRNVEAASELAEAIDRAGLLPCVQIFFAPVSESDGLCADMKGRCYSNEEFARCQLRLYEDLVRSGFHRIDYPDVASGGVCGADTDNGFVVGPNGLIFKCWEEITLRGEKSVGSIFTAEPEPHQRANLDRYRSWDPFEKAGCAACEILPICMGGCPLKGLERGRSDRGLCSPWKYNLEGMLRLRRACEART